MHKRLFGLAIATAAAATFATVALAQDKRLGTSAADVPSARAPAAAAPASAGRLRPFKVFEGSAARTAGVGLRNVGTGGITISGLPGPATEAFVYWDVISAGPPPAAASSIKVKRLFPTPATAFIDVPGVVVGAGASPCWSGDTNTVYRAPLPVGAALVSGNGVYQVYLPDSATGSRAGEDPWLAQPLPLAEGASLVVVGQGSQTIALYDAPLSGFMFVSNPGVVYTLLAPAGVLTATTIHTIGADGQKGSGDPDFASSTGEISSVNGARFAGKASPAQDSDWNGNSSFPLPQLWDDNAHGISATGNLRISVIDTTGADCLVYVGNVVAFDPAPPPTTSPR